MSFQHLARRLDICTVHERISRSLPPALALQLADILFGALGPNPGEQILKELQRR